MEDLILIAATLCGHEEAFNRLYTKHKARIRGHIRSKVDNDQDADELSQDVWIMALEKLPQFDPRKATFGQFLGFWTGIMLLRFWKKQAAYRKVFVELATLCARFPDIKNEEEVVALLRKTQAAYCTEDSAPDPDELNRLLLLALGGNSPPHQLIAFIWVKLLCRKPSQLVRELSGEPLSGLVNRLQKELAEEFAPNEKLVNSAFLKIIGIMQERKTVSDVLDDPKTESIYSPLLDCAVADTSLSNYYTSNASPDSVAFEKDSSQNLSNWCVSVRRRIVAELARMTGK